MLDITVIDRIRRIADGFSSLSLGIRIAIGALAGALGSSSFLGFIAEYATYNYAMAYGVRVPTEGVPYLSFFITLVSLGLMGIALACFIGLFFLLRSLIQLALAHIGRDKSPQEIADLPLRKYLMVAVPGAIFATQPVMQLMAISPNFFKSLPQYVTMGIFLGTLFVVLIFLRRPEWIKWFITLFFFCFVTLGIVGMFSPTTYGQFLHLSRYGGGVEFQIYRNCTESSKCISPLTGELFLRTKDYFIFRDSKEFRISEIPAAEVSSYAYPSESRWNKY